MDHIVRPLSDNDRKLLRCAYLWVSTYNHNPALQHADPWQLLQYIEQLQTFVLTLSPHFRPFVYAHRTRYEALSHECSFGYVLYHDFSPLKALVAEHYACFNKMLQ